MYLGEVITLFILHNIKIFTPSWNFLFALSIWNSIVETQWSKVVYTPQWKFLYLKSDIFILERQLQ